MADRIFGGPTNLEPIFGDEFGWEPWGMDYHIMPDHEGDYRITQEAIDKLKSGHKISPARLAKLQQIIRFKNKDRGGPPAEIRVSHL